MSEPVELMFQRLSHQSVECGDRRLTWISDELLKAVKMSRNPMLISRILKSDRLPCILRSSSSFESSSGCVDVDASSCSGGVKIRQGERERE